MKYFRAYLDQRFPLHINGLLILSYFLANYLVSEVAVSPGKILEVSWRFLEGSIVLLFMFYHLRVIDEHKDYERDILAHPDRLLSRGLITLNELRLTGILAITVEITVSAWLGLPAFLTCMILLAISWLIYKEFYAPVFLEKHLLENALLHLLVMPIYSLFVFSVASGRFPWTAPTAVLLYAWVSYGVGFAYELARKTRIPQDERPGLITYSRVIGPYRAALYVFLALTSSSGFSLLVGEILDFGAWYHISIIMLLALVAVGLLHFRFRPNSTTANNLQIYTGLFIFAFDWLISIELVRLHGIRFV